MPTFDGDDSDNQLSGGAENDTINGLGGNDRLIGNGGDDTIEGGTGDDFVAGGAVTDGTSFEFYPAGPTIRLPAHYFPIVPDTDLDILRGGAGFDTIIASRGDTVDGGPDGAQFDVSYLGAQQGVTWLSGRGSDAPLLTVTNANPLWVQGSDFADSFSSLTYVMGMGGDDHIVTANNTARNLFADGGDGNDVIEVAVSGGSYQPIMLGGAGDDRITGDGYIDGGTGNDTITGNGTILGGDGNDTIVGKGERVDGGAGDDRITAGPGMITGGTGSDTIMASAESGSRWYGVAEGERDTVTGGHGRDSFYADYLDVIDGGAGTDDLTLSLVGMSSGFRGNLDGSLPAGLNVTNVEEIRIRELTNHNDVATVTAAFDPTELFTNDGDDYITVEARPNPTIANYFSVYAGAGNDIIESTGSVRMFASGGDGNDLFIVGQASNEWRGGDGSDTIDYRNARSGVTVELRVMDWQYGSFDAVTHDGFFDYLYNIENARGSAFSDNLSANALENTLVGRAGNDTMRGEGGNDVLYGGQLGVADSEAEVDYLFGGAGDDLLVAGLNDEIDGGEGTDILWLSLMGASSGVTVDMAAGLAGQVNLGTTRITGIEVIGRLSGTNHDDQLTGGIAGDTLYGEGGRDILTGNRGADVLHGGDGNDTLSSDRPIGFDGNTEVDTIFGGAGNDMMFAGYGDIVDGGDGFDTLNLSYIGASHGITGDTNVLFRGLPLSPGGGTVANIERFDAVALTQFADQMVIGDQADPATAYGYGGDDHLIGQEHRVVFYGGEGNDLLVGSTVGDELYGENGNDILIGGPGSDELWGGAGNDRFLFTHTGATDTILDFVSGVDSIDLTGIDADTSIEGDQAFSFIGSAAFSGRAGELRVYDAGSVGNVAAIDVNGDSAADLMINLGSAQAGSGDFLL